MDPKITSGTDYGFPLKILQPFPVKVPLEVLFGAFAETVSVNATETSYGTIFKIQRKF